MEKFQSFVQTEGTFREDRRSLRQGSDEASLVLFSVQSHDEGFRAEFGQSLMKRNNGELGHRKQWMNGTNGRRMDEKE